MLPHELRKKFLEENGEFLLTELSDILHGKAEAFKCQNSYTLNTSVTMLVDMIKQAADLQQVEVSSARAVMEELAKGKLSEQQADRILDMLQKKQQLDLLPKLIEQMEQLNGNQIR